MPRITAQALLEQLDPQMLIWGGLAGVMAGTLFFIIFAYRRLRWHLRRLTKTTKRPPGLMAGFRNGTALLLMIVICGLLLFVGLFFQSYHRFNLEKPVAEIITSPMGNPAKPNASGAHVQYRLIHSGQTRHFFVNGDQWMIEGDILKWHRWITLMGLDTRYRLTRLSGRYLDLEKERNSPRTLLSLAEARHATTEAHPVWRWLYRSGHQLPLVDTVYGNAAYQNLSGANHYLVFVTPSGFMVRKKEDNP